jgi:hypothetical protein
MLVLIAGITGSLGQRLASVAISKGLSVRGLGRNPNNLSPKLSRQLESFIKSDSYYDIPALEKAVTGVDAVINAYAPHPVLDLDGHLLLPRAAERGQIKIFIASSWSRDWTNLKFGDFGHYNNHIAFEHQVAVTALSCQSTFLVGCLQIFYLRLMAREDMILVARGHGCGTGGMETPAANGHGAPKMTLPRGRSISCFMGTVFRPETVASSQFAPEKLQ